MLLTHIFAGAQIGPTQVHIPKKGPEKPWMAMDGLCFEDFGPAMTFAMLFSCDGFLIFLS